MSSRQEPDRKNPEKPSTTATDRDFIAHFERAYPRLATIAAAVLGRQEGAEDIVQEAAQIAVVKGKQFTDPGAFVAWMIGVVRRCALNQRRKLQRRRTYVADPTELTAVVARNEGEEMPIDLESGQLRANQSSFEDHVLEALQELSADARCCLLLRTVHELSYAEIARQLGMPRGTAMSHVHRSRQWLRQRLDSAYAPRTSSVGPSDESP